MSRRSSSPNGSGRKRWRGRIETSNPAEAPPRTIFVGLRNRLLVAFVFGLTAALYLFDLANTPVYFGGDEAHFAVGAHAIATTGRNLNGDRLPVFVNLVDPLDDKRQVWGETWYQPLLYYLMVPFVAVLPFTASTARLPMALVAGLVTPLLMFAVARRIIGQTFPAIIAALIIALAPTHLVLGRQALDYTLPLPFVIGWLWCLHAFRQAGEQKYLTRAGLILGIGCYSYIASWAIMPALLLITLIVASGFSRTVPESALRRTVPAVIAFAIPVAVGVLWVLAHSEMIQQTVTRYGVTEGPKYGFIETYLSMLHPNVWFVRGGPSLVTSTARSGFVLLPVAVLLLAGIGELWRRKDWVAAVIVAGLIVSPLPAAFKGEPSMIQRAVYLLPFIGLLGGLGVVWLWRSPLTRMVAIAAMVMAPIQFGYFYFDYFTHYKFRSAFYYDNVAFRDVAAYLVAADGVSAYYFDEDLDDVSVKWRYYTIASGREELLTRTRYIDPGSLPDAPGSLLSAPAVPSAALLVTYDRTSRLEQLKAAGWAIEKLVSDVDNRPAAVILRKF